MSVQITTLLFVTITLLAASSTSANPTTANYESGNETDYSGTASTPGSSTVDSMINETTAPIINGTDAPSYYNTSSTPQISTGNFSMINETIAPIRYGTDAPFYYNTSTTLQTSRANNSMINGTTAPMKNETDTSSYYNTSTTPQTSRGNFSMDNKITALIRIGTDAPSYYNTSTTPLTVRNFLFGKLASTTAQPNSSFGTNQVQNYKTDDDEYNAKKADMEKRFNSLFERNQFSEFMNNPFDHNITSNDTKNKFAPEITLQHHTEPQETTTPFSDDQMLNRTVNSTEKQHPNKFQVLFDIWLLDAGEIDKMGKVDLNNLSMSETPEIVDDDYTLIQKKQMILNTFDVLSKFIEKYVSNDQPGSESLLRLFNGSTTMQDLVMIANVKDFVQLNGTTDKTNSDHKEMGKHEQKVSRKIYTYTEEEIISNGS